MPEPAWYWCLDHNAVEPEASSCAPGRRLGPFPSRAAAANWKETFEARNKAQDREDAEWEGTDPDE